MVKPSDNSMDAIRRDLLLGARGLAANARRLMRWQAILQWLAIGLAVLIGLLISDMLLRREELGLRILSLIVWIVAIGFTAYHLLRPAWRFSPTPLQIAQWIEKGRPELGEQLSTVVELAELPATETRYGSPQFRERALRDWSTRHANPDWYRYIDYRNLRRALLVFGAMATLLVGMACFWPTETAVALTRLTMPWGSNQWPRRDHLQLLNLPKVIAIGSELQLEVTDDRPPLPERVEVHYRYVEPNQVGSTTQLETIQVGDVAIGNLPAISTAIEVRAVGGDDQTMPWQRIDVVQPPELIDFQFSIQPPAYSGQPLAEVVGRRIAVLAGSRIEFNGKFNEPIKHVQIDMMDVTAEATEPDTTDLNNSGDPRSEHDSQKVVEQEPLVATLGSDGRELRIAAASGSKLEVNQSLHWQLAITTAEGLNVSQPERWSIELNRDAPPVVAFRPIDLNEITADAQLILRGQASDDLGLTATVAKLRIEGVESSQPSSLEIWRAPADDTAGPLIRELAIETTWNIPQVASLVAGQRIAVWLEACDSSGQWSQSQTQTLDIRDAKDLLKAIEEKQSKLLSQMRELVNTQRRNAQLFSRTWELAQHSEHLQREQIDIFNNVAQVQRALHEQLRQEGVRDGLADAVATLRDLLSQNRLDETELSSELQRLYDSLNEIERGPLQQAMQSTAATADQAQSALRDQTRVTAALSQAADQATRSQAEALRELESLLDRLVRNESLQQVEQELAQILNQQNALRRDTDQIQLERLSTAQTEAMKARQTALGADQQGLARRLDDLVERARRLQNSSSSDQPKLKSQLERATQMLIDSQVSDKMRRSTEEIRQQQFAQAAATQLQIAKLLNDTLRQLNATGQSQLGNLQNRADDLRQTGQQLSELASEQADLAEAWQAPDAPQRASDLLREQVAVQQATRRLAEQAEQTGNASLAAEIGNVTESQRDAQQAGEQKDFQRAAKSAEQAAKQLAQTAENLNQRADQLDEQVAQQQIFQLAAAIDQLTGQQRQVQQQIEQLSQHTETAERPLLAPSQEEIRRAATQQETIRQSLRELRAHTSKLPTFDWTLEQTELAMSRAVAAAQRYRLKPDASDAAAEATLLLELAADAVKREPSNTATNNGNPQADHRKDNDNDQSQGDAAQERPLPFVASLKLLRSLQHELNQQTQQLQASQDETQRRAKLAALAAMQQALSEQIEQLLRESNSASP